MNIVPGAVFHVRYPFVHCVASNNEDGHEVQFESWRPGTFAEGEDPVDGSLRAMADAEGKMVLTVVSVHKPGKYLTRVFFTRYFVSPDGLAFGKSNLRCFTIEKFRRTARGYKRHWAVCDRPQSEWKREQ